jgi:hypothetical protein
MSAENQVTPIGATEELSLRVSVATLVRVVFQHPKDGSLMLALERRATLVSDAGEPRVVIKCQPFGGAVRIQNLILLQSLVGDFHFDSERSRSELDFRLFIRPSDWDAVREFCLRHFENGDESVLEISPARELAEELADALNIELRPDQYTSKPLGTVTENDPAATENVNARGCQTVRVYRIFEARILDPALCQLMIANSEHYSNHDLREAALQDARRGGRGRANALVTLPVQPLMKFYRGLSPETRNAPVIFVNNSLDSNVCAVLEDVPVPKYIST